MDYGPLWSSCATRFKASEIRELLKLTEKPDIVSFAGGLPDPATFPVQAVEEATHRVLRDHASAALQYGTTEGLNHLRETLAQSLAKDGIDVHPDEITITNGSQQGLDLLGRTFIDPGDTIIVSNPTYLGALQAFNYYDARYAGCDSDGDGVIPESLEATILDLKAKGIRPKFIYLVPTFQNPAGTVIPEARRRAILDLAYEHDLLIVEDDPYGKLRFDGDPVPAMKSLDRDGDHVIYLGTFSKILVPGFRLAWCVAPPAITRKMVIGKQSVDLCTNAFTQYIADDLLTQGIIDAHLPKIIEVYRRKRDIMMGAMDDFFPKENVSWTRSQGGLFTWAELPLGVNAVELLPKAVEQGNVAYVPGKSFFPDPDVGFNTLRLNFSFPGDEAIRGGIEQLGGVLTDAVEQAKLTA